jgi:hypothetical protein
MTRPFRYLPLKPKMASAPLKKTSISQIFIGLVLGVGVGLGLNWFLLNRSLAPFAGNLPVLILLFVISAWTLYRSWRVKRYKDAKDPRVSGLYAYSTYVLAKSVIIAGFTLTGIYAGALLIFWLNPNPSLFESYWLLTCLNLIVSLGLAICGLIGEHFCKLDPPSTSTAGTPV